MTRLLEAENRYQNCKTRLALKYLKLADKAVSPIKKAEMYDLISDTMARRPNYDMLKCELKNQNIVDLLKMNAVPLNKHNNLEISNVMTTFLDAYMLEMKHVQ